MLKKTGDFILAMLKGRRFYTGNSENKQEIVYWQWCKEAGDCILAMLKTSRRWYTVNAENKLEILYWQC
jgi:hypothetical protein